jgi:predicted ATP-grasp superfamily ATP-dependent carboligase
LRLLVYEHVSGGGFCEKPIPASILSEGFAMLRTVIEDANAAGHSVTTILDSRIAELNPPLEADRKISVHSFAEAENVLQEAAENSDTAYVIAPETNGTLQNLVETIEQSATLSLNSTASAIAKVSDKALLLQQAKKIGLATPEALAFSIADKKEIIVQVVNEKLGFPAIFKPSDGVGCEGLSLVKNTNHAKAAITKIAETASKRLIAQHLVQGTPVSVTLISNGTEATPITLNKQNVTLKTPNQNSSYNGGTTPFNSTSQNSAFATAKKLVESVNGLKGYIGVDLILTHNKPVIIEINPRLTTSYVGIRKALNLNLAQAIINSTLEHELPTNWKTAGHAYFAKVKTPNPTQKTLQESYGLPELISPPFPTPHEPSTCALLCSHGSTLRQAERDFKNAEKQLRSILCKGGRKHW